VVLHFNPKNLRYDDNGIPRLGPPEIEAITTELLSLYCPDVLQRPSITPVLVIIDKLRTRTKLTFEMGGLSLFKGQKVLGCVNLNTRTLSLDNILTGERRMAFLFTAAHEIGHWVIALYFFPLGTIAGVAMLLIGSAMSKKTLCDEFGNRVEKESRMCPHCRAEFLN
jgi:hypothetical protein